MCEVGGCDRPEAIRSTRKIACFLRLVAQVLENLESERGELFGERARVETGDERLAKALSPVEESPHRGRLVLRKEHCRIGVVQDDFTAGACHSPDRGERAADRLARQVISDA